MTSWYGEKDGTELEANKESPNGHCRDLVSGDPEVKLKSVSIWRMRDSAVCPTPVSLPPRPVLPTGKFSPPMLPYELPPVWDASLRGCHWREAEGCSGITKPGSASTSTTPQLRLLLLPLPLPAPQVANIKRIMEQKDEREGITGNYQP